MSSFADREQRSDIVDRRNEKYAYVIVEKLSMASFSTGTVVLLRALQSNISSEFVNLYTVFRNVAQR